MNAPMTPEQREAIAHQLGAAKPATDGLLGSLAESVTNVRTHDHPKWEDLYCMNLTSYMGERMAPVLRRLLEAEAEWVAFRDQRNAVCADNEELLARVERSGLARLQAENETRTVVRERDALRARVAELEARPSHSSATPAEIDAHVRQLFSEDAYLRYQQAIGEHVLAEAVEDTQVVRASADNDGLYNADWREGWDDAIERIDPDLNDPCPSTLLTLSDSVEDPHDSPLRPGACDACGDVPEKWCPDCAACRQGCHGGHDGNPCAHPRAPWGGAA
ncbi:hypothetical protein [Streptomyces sp. sk2.1]|uniref:hypothetical protein n=1 Tax=Streptomyces sp. sk2.1 TaxID=2478959 RepID=UPI0011E75327|nr:hypothetical protein [Streptomyces sp. sk2.1]TXS78650.1 hypothetical protein EAO76_09820 [Streptomyces sp. sk2.1]